MTDNEALLEDENRALQRQLRMTRDDLREALAENDALRGTIKGLETEIQHYRSYNSRHEPKDTEDPNEGD